MLPTCPYCGLKLGYIESFTTKNKSTFKCRGCKEKSIVNLKNNLYKILLITLALLLGVFFASIFLGENYILLGLLLIVLLFCVFYSITPHMVILEKKKNTKITLKNLKIQETKEHKDLKKESKDIENIFSD